MKAYDKEVIVRYLKKRADYKERKIKNIIAKLF
jgi:hypothetical protein